MIYRLGSVPYLNAKPLLAGWQDPIAFLPPNRLSRALTTGDLDAALVPVLFPLEHPEYLLVDGVGIGSRGAVYSVILVSSVPQNQIRTIARDPESLTSNLLAWVLFDQYLKQPIDLVDSDYSADAKILIGDRAMDFRRSNPETPVMDLGEMWWKETALPFVFAVWAIRPQLERSEALDLAEKLRTAKTRGMATLSSFIRNPRDYQYLHHDLHYPIGPEEKAGIDRFADGLHRGGLLPRLPRMKWI